MARSVLCSPHREVKPSIYPPPSTNRSRRHERYIARFWAPRRDVQFLLSPWSCSLYDWDAISIRQSRKRGPPSPPAPWGVHTVRGLSQCWCFFFFSFCFFRASCHGNFAAFRQGAVTAHPSNESHVRYRHYDGIILEHTSTAFETCLIRAYVCFAHVCAQCFYDQHDRIIVQGRNRSQTAYVDCLWRDV